MHHSLAWTAAAPTLSTRGCSASMGASYHSSRAICSGIASNSCDKSEFVERKSDDDWNNDGYMWITPQPAISLN